MAHCCLCSHSPGGHGRWITKLCNSCPKAQSFCNRRVKVFLGLRSSKGGTITTSATSVTPPIVRVADTGPETVQLISELHKLMGEGFDLRDAVAKSTQPAAATQPTVTSEWPVLVEKFQADREMLAPVTQTSWKRNYKPFLERIVLLMGTSSPPANAGALGIRLIEPWAEMPTNRGKAIKCLRLFL